MSKPTQFRFNPLWIVVAFFWASPVLLWGQAQVDFVLKGTVADKQGQPLIGVAIQIVELRQGSVSDLDGAFEFEGSAPAGTYTLQASYLGYGNYTQSITIDGQNTQFNLAITMLEDALALDEVVVTGSTLKSTRRQLGNAVNIVNADKLQNAGTDNLISALQGKVAGAQVTQNSGDPAGGISVRLRGVNSIRGNSDPLYVIDGVVVSNSTTNVTQISVSAGEASLGTNRLADINPKDIESINVISGAAAAAVYGSRAANGVVLITTKRGQSGKPQITLSTSVNMNQLRKKVPITTYGKQFGSTSLRLHTISNFTTGPTVNVLGRNLSSQLVDVTRYDYQDDVFQTGMGTDNYLSVAGGSDKTKYFASISYMTNEGIVRNTDFTRYGLRLNLDQQLAPWIKASFGLSYNNSFSNEKPSGNSFFSPINSINITNNTTDAAQRDANGNLQAVEPTRVNPLSVIEDFDISQEVNRAISNLTFTLFPVKGMTIDWILGADVYGQVGQTFIPVYPYAGVNPAYYANGYAGNVNTNFRLFKNDVNVNYAADLTDRLRSSTTAGFNYQYSRSEALLASGETLLPNISTINGATTTLRSGYGLDQYSLSGYFLQQTFGWNNQLFLTLAGRVDGSSKFSEEENTQFYPKASASWVVSDNDFWKNSFGSAWNGLKLRASWGESGGLTGIGSYDRFWQFSPVNFLNRPTFVPSTQLANPLIVPERTRELEIGADFSFLDSRVNLALTYYKQDVFDLVVNRLLAASSGGRSIVDNVGEMENKGIEANLGLNVARKTNLNWDVNLVFSRNKNEVVNAGSPLVGINNVAGAPAFLVQGQPASVMFGTIYARNSDGSLLLGSNGLPLQEFGTVTKYNGETIPAGAYVLAGQLYTPARNSAGQPTGSPLRDIIADPNPDFIASLGSTLRYKDFSFSFLFDGVFGNEVFNADKRTRQGVGIGDYAEKELKGELPRGYIWSIYQIEEWRVDDGSFIKLRELALSYKLPKLFEGMQDWNLSFVGRNLLSFDDYNGYDPETNAGGNSDLLRGVDFGNVPIPRTYQVVLTAKF